MLLLALVDLGIDVALVLVRGLVPPSETQEVVRRRVDTGRAQHRTRRLVLAVHITGTPSTVKVGALPPSPLMTDIRALVRFRFHVSALFDSFVGEHGVAARFGKMPTTSVRRRISLFRRSSWLSEQIWRRIWCGKPVGMSQTPAEPRFSGRRVSLGQRPNLSRRARDSNPGGACAPQT
jgi:hypothetical protein